VPSHRVVVEPALHNRAQPLPELRDWRVPPTPDAIISQLNTLPTGAPVNASVVGF
jgi:hypothetical protein